MKAARPEVDRAHAIYTKRNLALYDWWVFEVSSRRFWQCDAEWLLGLFRAHLTSNHLEVGAGTGHLLARTMPPGDARLVLLDINRNCLERAGARLAAFRPERIEGNVLEPLDLPSPQFDSISLNYVLHCLPGCAESKAKAVFAHLLPHLADGGTLFGSSVLGREVPRSPLARVLMAIYNRKGVFSNREDSLGGLMEALSASFRVFHVEVRGCVALFWGKEPKRGRQDARATE